ncbi:MAG TPA: hypothetical protein VGR14_15725 [Verrucomicrobiae bacterium]|jgi:hypothetical protein|nr:hypothetical protein [Verrucomicrobiae bacterium]
MSDQIEIRIDGKKLTPEKFLDGVKEFLALTQGVAKNVTSTPISWLVEVDKGSAIVRMRAANPSRESEKSIDAVCQGIRSLRNGSKAMPNGFTRKEVSSAKILAELVDGEEVQSISIRNGGSPEDLPKSVVQIADTILAGQSHIAFGSLEGDIVSLTARHGFCCIIYDPIQRREITCYLPKEDVQKEAVKGYTKRVLAGGLIHYAKEGYAVSITVDTIRIFPPDSELPAIEDVQRIYKLYR